MKRILQLAALFTLALCVGAAFGQITSIRVLPPVTGYSTTSGSGTIQLSAACYNGSSITSCPTLTWGSDTAGVATVNSSGLVTGAGVSVFSAAEIYAYSGTVIGHHQVQIGYAPTTVTITTGFAGSHNIVSEVGANKTVVVLSAYDDTYSPFGASDACAWTSADPSIASVNNIGEVTGVAAGTTTITCTVGSHTPGYSVTVTTPATPLNVYYFRTDGSNSTNCTGLVYAAYPGSGTGQSCAWDDLTYIGSFAPGDTAILQSAPAVFTPSNYINVPSGTPDHYTQIFSTSEDACTTDRNHPGNRSRIVFGGFGFGEVGKQNITFGCIDVSSGWDCNSRLNDWDFPCPGDVAPRLLYADQFTANIHRTNARFHQGQSTWTGAQGPGVVDTNASTQGGYLYCNSFDDPFGQAGVRADGFSSNNSHADFCGMTEENPKTLTSVVRDGSGHLTVVFAAGQHVNYIPGTNLYLEGGDIAGTFPVTTVNFNQQTVSIVGGTVTLQSSNTGQVWLATFTTDATPTFAQGDFVQITGASPSFLNDTVEVWTVGTNQFTANVSMLSHPGWTSATIAGSGTVSTANTVVATAAGSALTASTLGTASHVFPFHRGFDQGAGGISNGDAWGAGYYTMGVWSALGNECKYNWQDCWDSLHGTIVSNTVDRLLAYGNEGIPAKVGIADAVSVTNSLLVSNAGAMQAFNPDFPPDYNQYIGMPYRANNGFLSISRPWSQMVVSNNTWQDLQNVAWDSFYAGTTTPLPMASYILQNNLFVCASDVNGKSAPGVLPAIFFQEAGDLTPWSWNHNQGYNCRDTTGDSGTGNNYALAASPVTTAIPNITTFLGERNAINFDMTLFGGSPSIGAGLHNAYTPTLDFTGATRPNPPSIGALELGGTPPVGTVLGGGVVLGGSVVIP